MRQPARSPFRPVAPTLLAAVAFAGAALLWSVAGDVLPGGRWLAVHLFTLGVLTNLVLVFTEHFGRTLTRRPEQHLRWQPLVANLAIVTLLVGMQTSTTWALGLGGTAVTGVVLGSYVRLRRMRRDAVGARFTWVVRVYERAHGAFVHGAVLGVLMGTGVLAGDWYASARLAHLHVNVLGWGGLTLLATLVFFGPTLVRTRIVEGADERAAAALRLGASGLSIGVVLLLLTGIGDPWAMPLRLGAAAGLAVFAGAATTTCLAVARAAGSAGPTAARLPVIAVAVWFPVLAWADVIVVATEATHLLDALGLGMLLGVLAQAMLTTLVYLAPLLLRATPEDRDVVRTALERGADTRAALWNSALLGVVAAAVVRDVGGAAVAAVGWLLLALVLAWTLAAAIRAPAAD